MTSVNVQRKLNMSQAEARLAAEKVADKLAREYGVIFSWEGDCAAINGPGVKGSCEVSDGTVDIKLTLGFLVAPFAVRVKDEINKYFDRLAEN
ncbi:MAG: polyhydroxyalkanoic acid system family protein [Pseudomonadales bacterium]|nr:polyhydroxyalkanoic acid system family protein [Pseudomonadales bacterium]